MKQKEYKDRTTISLSIERNLKEEIEEMAGRESFSSFVNRVLQEEIQRKKVIGSEIPINLNYGNENLKIPTIQIPLDHVIEQFEAEELINNCMDLNKLLGNSTKIAEFTNYKLTGKYRRMSLINSFVPQINRKGDYVG